MISHLTESVAVRGTFKVLKREEFELKSLIEIEVVGAATEADGLTTLTGW